MNQNEIISVLKMDKIVFDKIEFNRFGFKNENKINMELTTSIGKNEGENRYKVSLILKGNKKDEYNLSVILTGYFSFNLKSVIITSLFIIFIYGGYFLVTYICSKNIIKEK